MGPATAHRRIHGRCASASPRLRSRTHATSRDCHDSASSSPPVSDPAPTPPSEIVMMPPPPPSDGATRIQRAEEAAAPSTAGPKPVDGNGEIRAGPPTPLTHPTPEPVVQHTPPLAREVWVQAAGAVGESLKVDVLGTRRPSSSGETPRLSIEGQLTEKFKLHNEGLLVQEIVLLMRDPIARAGGTSTHPTRRPFRAPSGLPCCPVYGERSWNRSCDLGSHPHPIEKGIEKVAPLQRNKKGSRTSQQIHSTSSGAWAGKKWSHPPSGVQKVPVRKTHGPMGHQKQ